MKEEEAIRRTKKYVKRELGKGNAHGWWHVYRVWKNAVKIAKAENADLFLVQLAALLHDVADWKFCYGDLSTESEGVREWLEGLGIDEEVISQVCKIVKNVSFKGVGVESEMETIEGKVVQDADRLDAIGAIGIARAFAYGGRKKRPIYDPKEKPERHDTFKEYKNSESCTINHFYEKLILLRDRMNTETAKRIAEERHEFMEEFLERFFKEWKHDW